MAYRANFLFFWFCANGFYFVFILSLSQLGDKTEVNTGGIDVLTGFALYLAGVVLFKVFFASLFMCKW